MKLKIAAAAMLSAVGMSSIHAADAAVVMTMLEVGSDVVVPGGGTIDLQGFVSAPGTGTNGTGFMNASL